MEKLQQGRCHQGSCVPSESEMGNGKTISNSQEDEPQNNRDSRPRPLRSGGTIWTGAIQALKDPKVYMLILLQFSLLVGMAYVRPLALIVSRSYTNNTRLISSPRLSAHSATTRLPPYCSQHLPMHWLSSRPWATLYIQERQMKELSISPCRSRYRCWETSFASP